ncbi:MAG: patatin family protein [Erysipelotrichaceae bacterium]|nr:patatin family protein [Erysipelotrichaceae bacterium]
MKRIALVMEGGGMRGAYTTGVLTWLIDHGITFDNHYGISTGAIYLCAYLLKNKEDLYEMSTNHIADKKTIGIRPLLREGQIVGYNYLFDYIIPDVLKMDMKKLKEITQKEPAKVGLYDLSIDKTIYVPIPEMDDHFQMLKGSVTLPVIGHKVTVDGKEYLDGGITDMIPIEQAIRDQNEKFLIITTKPKDYVRKPANWFLTTVMRLAYPKHRQIYEDYKIRHIHYNEQIDLIKKQVEEKKAVWLLPSQVMNVSRLRGDKEDLKKLFQLGYDDAEARKEEIFALLKDE